MLGTIVSTPPQFALDRLLDFFQEIGKGGFGTVFRARYQQKTVALKEVNNSDEKQTAELFDQFRREIWLTTAGNRTCNCLFWSAANQLRAISEFCFIDQTNSIH